MKFYPRKWGSEEGTLGGGCGSPSLAGVILDPLALLVQVTQLDGKPPPVGIFTARIIARQIMDLMGKNPIDVKVITEQEAIVQMEPESPMVSVAQVFHNLRMWDGCATEIMCLVSSQKQVQEIAYECETYHHQSQHMEQEMQRIQQEQQHSCDQMVDLLQKLSEEIKKVEELRAQVGESVEPPIKKEVSGAGLAMEKEDLTTSMVLWFEDTKISKPPQVCVFSRNEPVPKEEGNVDQWEFQVRGL